MERFRLWNRFHERKHSQFEPRTRSRRRYFFSCRRDSGCRPAKEPSSAADRTSGATAASWCSSRPRSTRGTARAGRPSDSSASLVKKPMAFVSRSCSASASRSRRAAGADDGSDADAGGSDAAGAAALAGAPAGADAAGREAGGADAAGAGVASGVEYCAASATTAPAAIEAANNQPMSRSGGTSALVRPFVAKPIVARRASRRIIGQSECTSVPAGSVSPPPRSTSPLPRYSTRRATKAPLALHSPLGVPNPPPPGVSTTNTSPASSCAESA